LKLPSSFTYGFWLALLRIYAGCFWLMHGVPKFTQSAAFMPPDGMIVGYLTKAVTQTSGPYQAFLQNVVLPNVGLFAELVRLGEVVTGCLLFLGFFTRLGGTLGIILGLNYLFSKGDPSRFSAWSGLDGAAIALSAINLVLPTGRVFGIDALLGRSKRLAETPVFVHPGNPPSRAEFVDEPPMTGPTAPHS
jgi:uncharacterized membrane protein YphA (DoxX/SURF4 family)